MVAAAVAAQGVSSARRRNPCWTGTPEIYFAKAIDNSRLVKVEDPRRGREMRQFGFALELPVSAGDDVCLAAFQGHRVRIQDRIAEERAQRPVGNESRAAAGRSFAARSQSGLIAWRDSMGLQSPQAGQVIRMDSAHAGADDAGDGELRRYQWFRCAKIVRKIQPRISRMNTD